MTGTEVTGLDLRPTSYADPVVRALEEEVQAEYVRRYGGPDDAAVDSTQFDAPDGLFLVGWAGGVPVATGGLRRDDATSAEVKRMYVVPGHRGRGYARAVLAALEEHARRVGYERILLETGTMQPEAIALYTSSGYEPVQGFGHYAWSPLARAFVKHLPAASP